jgi:hypothetical protein
VFITVCTLLVDAGRRDVQVGQAKAALVTRVTGSRISRSTRPDGE